MALKLEVHIGNCPFEFNDICLGRLRFFNKWKDITSIVYRPPHSTLPFSVAKRWFDQLSKWGFGAPRYDLWNTYHHEVNNGWWFASMTLCRYTDEFPEVVKIWEKKVYHEKWDPWITLLALHRPFSGNPNINSNHAIVSPYFSEVRDPVSINKTLRKEITGFNFAKLQSIHKLYGGDTDLELAEARWKSDYKTPSLDDVYQEVYARTANGMYTPIARKTDETQAA